VPESALTNWFYFCVLLTKIFIFKMKTSVVHGDFRLDNIIFDKQDSRLELVMALKSALSKNTQFLPQFCPNID
jgi:hypothetical protein